jgi:uroporphyrinogen decarboxylase
MSSTDFPPLKNDLILRVCRGELVERVPIWIMRQAGRYLPEYKTISAQHSFFEVCRTPTLASEVTLQPVRRFDLDAAIIFSDILVIPQALGMQVEMVANEGPCFPQPLKIPDDINTKIDRTRQASTELKYVYEAITLTRHALNGQCPLIGFTGAPWTLMSYMIEGKHKGKKDRVAFINLINLLLTMYNRCYILDMFYYQINYRDKIKSLIFLGKASSTMSKAKRWLYSYEKESHDLLNLLANFIIDHLVEQIAAGAQLVQLFESHCACLTPDLFQRFSFSYLCQIAKGVRAEISKRQLSSVPFILFAKDAHYGLQELATTGLFDVISLDWTIPATSIHLLREENPTLTLQGNLDPCALYSSKENLEKFVRDMLEVFGTTRYIANLGHGIYPDMSVENVQWFIDAVHQISKEMNDSKQNQS